MLALLAAKIFSFIPPTGNALRHVIFGVELFPKRSFNLRLGYNFRRSQELKLLEQRTFSGISLGFGLKFNNAFDTSFQKCGLYLIDMDHY